MKESELDNKCMWYIVIQRGKTFDDAGRTDLVCYRCDGTKECGDRLGCDRFIINESKRLLRLPNDYNDWIYSGDKRRIGEHNEDDRD